MIADLRYYWCTEAELDGIPLVISRTGWTGEVGYELYLRDASRGHELWDARDGAPAKSSEIRAIAPSDQRRMEAGIFNYGNDMDVTNNPFEVTGLERLVELGQRQPGHRARRRSSGSRPKVSGRSSSGCGSTVSRWRCGSRTSGRSRRRAARSGRLTSAAYSPRLRVQHGVRMGADRAGGAMGTRVLAMSPGGPLDAEVVPLPFWDPAKAVPKA